MKRRSQPIVRSSSVHDLNRHEVFRANELDYGPIIGQGFYGIARTVSELNSEPFLKFIRVYLRLRSEKLVR